MHALSQASASITAQNFLAPADDLGYKLEYRHPYFWSGADPRRTALALSVFNARKLSGVFTPGTARRLLSRQTARLRIHGDAAIMTMMEDHMWQENCAGGRGFHAVLCMHALFHAAEAALWSFLG